MMTIISNDESQSPILEAALAYARAGLYIYPSPRKNGKAYVKWSVDSTRDEETIRGWWKRWPDALICLNCGKSEVGVIDVDTLEGHGVDGAKSLDFAILDHGPLPETLQAVTPTEGKHIFFRDPGSRLKTGSEKIGPGIDTRGRGGMVVLAPSVIKDRGAYRFINAEAFNFDNLPPVPEWVIELCGAPNDAGPVPDAECDPVYTEEEFAERLNLLNVDDFNNYDRWLRLMFACTHSSTVADGKAAFMEWTTANGIGAYAGDYDIISDKWDTNWRNGRNKAGNAARVGTFNKFLRDAGHEDKVKREPEIAATEEFTDDPEVESMRTFGTPEQIAAQVRQRQQDKADGITKSNPTARPKVFYRPTDLHNSMLDAMAAIKRDKNNATIFFRGPEVVRLNRNLRPEELKAARPTDLERKAGALVIREVVPDFMMLRLAQAARIFVPFKPKGRPKKEETNPQQSGETDV
jgi:Bifunctional DNA primase/polymerase, N-terminal/Primase C terminal 2 (PriCT-2)